MFRTLVRNVRRVLAYLPVIWRDRDWDYSHLLSLLDFKLGRMEKYFHEAKIIKESSRVAAEIRYTRRLLKKINTGSSSWKKLEKYIESRYGDIEIRTRPNGHFLTRAKIRTFSEEKQCKLLERELYSKQLEADKKDWDKLASVIKYKLVRWWD